MSVCKFLAADIPLQEVKPLKDYPVHIDIDKEIGQAIKMKEYNLFGYQVEVDKQITKEWYSKFKGWRCDCEHCRNFLLVAKKKQLPALILDTLKEFEIPPEKPTYVCEITSEEGKILYQFSYRMVGNILKESIDIQEKLEWGEARCCHEIYPYGAPGFSEPHFDLEFWVRLPKVYKYSDIADFLIHGREIEFDYKGRQYSITNHSGFWYLCDDTEYILLETICRFEEKKILVSKIAAFVIDDMKIQEIFDAGLNEKLHII